MTTSWYVRLWRAVRLKPWEAAWVLPYGAINATVADYVGHHHGWAWATVVAVSGAVVGGVAAGFVASLIRTVQAVRRG